LTTPSLGQNNYINIINIIIIIIINIYNIKFDIKY